MKYGTLNQRHECCDLDLFQRYDALYRGGKTFKKLARKFLNQNPEEGSEVYALRLQEASYRPYVGVLVDFFAAQLFSAPFHIRALDGAETTAPDLYYSEFREDSDGNGTDLASFMKSAFTRAMVTGAAWWSAEMPEEVLDEGQAPAASRLEWEQKGLGKARLCPIETDDVLDWETDDYGALQWVLTHSSVKKRSDPRQERQLVTETWRIFDATDIETFQITYDPQKVRLTDKTNIPSLGKRPHKFGRVPIVQMRFPQGLWLLDRASDAQVEHFRISAAMSWALKRSCYPMLVFRAVDGADGKRTAPVTGAGYMTVMGEKESLAWIAPETGCFETLANEIHAQVAEIHRIVSCMANAADNSAAALDRSGESKQADHEATEICLHSYAALVKAAIEETFELVSDARGDLDVTFSIEGMTLFNLEDISTSLNNIKTAHGLAIESKTLNKELGVKAADLLLPDASQQVKDAIRTELEEAAAKPEPAPVALPPTIPVPGIPPAAPSNDTKPTP